MLCKVNCEPMLWPLTGLKNHICETPLQNGPYVTESKHA